MRGLTHLGCLSVQSMKVFQIASVSSENCEMYFSGLLREKSSEKSHSNEHASGKSYLKHSSKANQSEK
jgi:hypothetical protein